MDSKGTASPPSNLPPIPHSEDGVVYIAIKGSLYASDCSVFGLEANEVKALSNKFPGSSVDVVNGVMLKTNVVGGLNSLSQLGYKVVASTGEAEVTWTMQREV